MEKVHILTVPIVAAMAVCLPGVLGMFGVACPLQARLTWARQS